MLILHSFFVQFLQGRGGLVDLLTIAGMRSQGAVKDGNFVDDDKRDSDEKLCQDIRRSKNCCNDESS